MNKKVTIWDLEYYEKISSGATAYNCFNADAMKVSSYHKQAGDSINFVVKPDDINRPFDVMYIFKRFNKTMNPPIKFFLDRKVKWGGEAVKARINGVMTDEILGCRPDYLLYPEHNTPVERAEQIRFFNNQAEPLTGYQDGSNSYSKKNIIVTDPYFGGASDENIIKALKILSGMKKVLFFEPIGIQKVINNKSIHDLFLELNFAHDSGSVLNWCVSKGEEITSALKFINELKEKHLHRIKIGPLLIDYRRKDKSHGEDPEIAKEDFTILRGIITEAKKNKIKIVIRMPITRMETPYYELFEELSRGTTANGGENFKLSGLEHLSRTYYHKYGSNGSIVNGIDYLNQPKLGDEVFRDLLLQTYKFRDDFILCGWGNNNLSINDVNGQMIIKEFELNI